MDVHQLADVFESFRTMALEQDGFDPVNYISVPGLTWDSAFRMTNSSIHLLQDSIMYECFEAGLRGGMTFVNRHHLRRNSPDDEDFDPSLPHTELLYIDANNLYGHALSMPLPQRDFEWVEEETERHHLIQQLPSIDVRGSIGFVAEVDLVIPDHLHDVVDDLPLAPEKMKISREWLTPHMVQQLDGGRFLSTEKLLLTHRAKHHYVIHFALLQFYLKMGVLITKTHRVVRFVQSPFFEPYITFNSSQRQSATNELTKEFYKLKNNSLYGKTVENVRGRMNMRLCNTAEKLRKYTSKALFQSCKMFGPDLVGVQLHKEEVNDILRVNHFILSFCFSSLQILLDKPVYIGQAVLDLSKLVMYQLRYEHLAAYSREFRGDIRIAGGDTDSFFLEIHNISLNRQLLPKMLEDGILDSSNYPPSYPRYSNMYKAQLGRVKDEGAGKVWKEWLLLRPKCYSMISTNQCEHRRAKGIQRSVVTKEISHVDYLAIFQGATDDYRKVRRFQSSRHAISTIQQRKRALCIFEDKREWMSLNDSVAYGHHYLPKCLRFSKEDLL